MRTPLALSIFLHLAVFFISWVGLSYAQQPLIEPEPILDVEVITEKMQAYKSQSEKPKSGGYSASQSDPPYTTTVETRNGGYTAAGRESGAKAGTEAQKKGKEEIQGEITPTASVKAQAAGAGRVRVSFEVRRKAREKEKKRDSTSQKKKPSKKK